MGTVRTEVPYNAAQDANKFPTQTFVSGTIGTADANGTAEIVRGGADPTTGAQYVYNLGPAGTTSTAISGGTLNLLEAGTFSTTTAAAINTFGTSGSIADSATGTIVSYSTPAGFKFRGFNATGEGQGYFYLQIGSGTTKYSYRTSVADKVARLTLPNPESIPTSTTLLLKVDNENGDTRNFEGAVLGE